MLTTTLIMVVVILGCVIVGGLLFMSVIGRYHKVGPNQAMVISGMACGTTGSKIRKGGGQFVFSLIQRVDYLSLEVMTIDVHTPEVYTSTGVPIIVDGVAQVKVKGDEESIRTACEQFLGKSADVIRQIAHETLAGHLRAIIGHLTVDEIYKERDTFSQSVQTGAAPDMANMGLQIVSFTLKEIRDNNGYLDALGRPKTALVKRDATIAQAEADRDATIKSAQAKQESEYARFVAETKIAESQRDYLIKKAEYDLSSNKKKAEADLAYDIQKAASSQNLKREEMQITLIEKEQQIKIAEQEIHRREKELEAQVKRSAEAEVYKVQKEADAARYRVEMEAQAQALSQRAQGEAAAHVTELTGNAEANRIMATGKAEAQILAAKGAAEAEAMKKKALSWQEYNQAAIAEMLISNLPAIVRAISEPLAKTDKITIVSTGDGPSGSHKLVADIAKSLAEIPAVVESLSGVNLKNLIEQIPGMKNNSADPAKSEGAKKDGRTAS